MCAVLLLTAVAAPCFAGEVIDGVVVTVNHKPIFRSDWDEGVCYELFMQHKPLAQMSDADRIITLQRLIDRQLLLAQMADTGYLQPSEEELQNDVVKLRSQVPEGQNNENWEKLLAGYDLSDQLLRKHLRAEFQVMNFVEVRLRPNIHVPPDEVEAYYRNQLLPDLEKAGGKIIAFADVEPRIRELLTQEHMNELLDAWLHNLRQQAEIRSSVPLPALHAPVEAPRVSGAY